MIEVLNIIATSWPIAVILIGLSVAFVVWRLVSRTIDHAEQSARDYRERERASRAVVVSKDYD